MIPHSRLLSTAFLLTLGACASASAPVVTAPAPAPPPATTPSVPSTGGTHTSVAVPRASVSEAPANWHLLDLASDGIAGIGAERAMRELLAGKQAQRTVVVAVIDGGVDTAHVDLRANLWTNAKEVAGNSRDDDNNGYVDDVRGWNFIGGADGRNVNHDTYEVTRLFAVCMGGSSAGIPRPSTSECDAIRRDYDRRRNEANAMLTQIRPVGMALEQAVKTLRTALGTDSLTTDKVQALRATSPDVQRARDIYLQLASQGATPKVVQDMLEHFDNEVRFNLDTAYKPRSIVGDNESNVAQRGYGNVDVTGPDATHGTHVAGIIGAIRGNNIGIDEIAPNVRIMPVRAVPNGDERDKDVANAIRYAADNGAHIINMSFGKGYSPHKSVVDDAVRYAESRGVLLVHAAGNDGSDNGVKPSFPTPVYLDKTRSKLWIEVGASSWKGGDSLVANFSNFNQQLVDVFAPGVDILSTMPGGGYERQSGTSMAAPVVSGVAALLMSYYPSLTAADVKRIILESATRHGDQQVVQPGADARVPFARLSTTGAIVNVYNAVKMAEELVRTRQ